MGSEAPKQMGFNATWSMAVGGIVGGGIFTVLGPLLLVAVVGRPLLLGHLD